MGKISGDYDWLCIDLLQNIQVAWESCKGISFSLMARQDNETTNLLAVMGSRRMCPVGWLSEATSSLSGLLIADLRAVRISAFNFSCDDWNRVGIG